MSGNLNVNNSSSSPVINPSSENNSSKGHDSPNMFLASTFLTGNDNYLQWKFSIKIALGAKKKLGFINGETEKPSTGTNEIAEWISTDCMVRSWLLNSISKEISGAFIFATTAHELWKELEEHFGESNGQLIYQLQRQIASIPQGDNSLSKYYTRLKQLWDELNCLIPLPPCNCGSAKSIYEITSMSRLMQFLIGLNDVYDNLRNQILVLDPLPSVHKAYSMALRVEKQREIQINFASPTDMSAMFVKTSSSNNFKRQGNNTQYKDKQDPKMKNQSDRYCNFCKIAGHTKESCFKLIGMKLELSFLNSSRAAILDKHAWILDTGATAHMCNDISILTTSKPVNIFTPIYLPDGFIKTVKNKGSVVLNSRITLENALHVPEFKCNLLSVKALSTSANIEFIFRPTYCVL
ncbi:hypothetical protein LXL04_037617 [Taraxacum kok-saghyz]